MCRRVTCRQCKKPTWAGCGAHVESVLAGVPRNERCQCRTSGPVKAAAAPAPAEGDSAVQRFRRWLGK